MKPTPNTITSATPSGLSLPRKSARWSRSSTVTGGQYDAGSKGLLSHCHLMISNRLFEAHSFEAGDGAPLGFGPPGSHLTFPLPAFQPRPLLILPSLQLLSTHVRDRWYRMRRVHYASDRAPSPAD